MRGTARYCSSSANPDADRLIEDVKLFSGEKAPSAVPGVVPPLFRLSSRAMLAGAAVLTAMLEAAEIEPRAVSISLPKVCNSLGVEPRTRDINGESGVAPFLIALIRELLSLEIPGRTTSSSLIETFRTILVSCWSRLASTSGEPILTSENPPASV